MKINHDKYTIEIVDHWNDDASITYYLKINGELHSFTTEQERIEYLIKKYNDDKRSNQKES